MGLVEIRGVTKTYQRGRERIEVLHGVDLDIPQGDFLALMGPSGSGKTTLLNLIGGLDTPTGGQIVVAGQRIDQLSNRELTRWRAAHVGFVFQFYNLMPVLSAQRNVELPLLLTSLPAAERRRRAGIARRPRPRHGRGDPHPAADAQPRPRQDGRDGHARPQGRRVRAAAAPPRQGHARRRRRAAMICGAAPPRGGPPRRERHAPRRD
jgi:ABC-type dipeptide/oligopeptide/nickel transport system ATPase component